MEIIRNARFLATSLSSLVLTMLLFLPTVPYGAHGQPVGLVCVSNVTGSCPSQPANFNGAVGSQFTVRVVVQDSDTFNAFDIFVKVDPTVLNPVSADIAGTILPDPFVAAVCVNGQPVVGNCVQPGNGPGVVEVAAVSLGGAAFAPATGLLFSITYQVVSAGSTVIGFQTGLCDEYTTTSNDSFCVVVVNVDVIVPENLQTAIFGGDSTVTVSIDIKPGSDPNSINVKSTGSVPVAILSGPSFDAPNEVAFGVLQPTFGRMGDENSLLFCAPRSPEDVNGDGLLDLVCHFDTQRAGFQAGDRAGILRGHRLDGRTIEGRDSVRAFFPGDVNGDLVVNVLDLVLVGASFGSTSGSPRYNLYADFNEDNTINILDLVVVGQYIGQHA